MRRKWARNTNPKATARSNGGGDPINRKVSSTSNGADKNEMARAMKNDTAHIRPVHPGDLPALQQICRQTFFETFSHSCTEADMQAYLAKSFAEAQLASELHTIQIQRFIFSRPKGMCLAT